MRKKTLAIVVILLIMIFFGYSEENKSLIFLDIEGTRKALSSIGIGSLGSWKDDMMGGYMSISNYYVVTGNNLAIYFTGVRKDKANLIEVALNINNASTKNNSLKILSNTVKKMFDVLKLTIPNTLLSNIEKEKESKYTQEEINIELRLDRSNIETWVLRLSPKG